MKKSYKQWLIGSLALSILSAGLTGAALAKHSIDSASPAASSGKSKNLIVMIGDGMGPAEVTAARYYARKYLGKDHLELDSYYVGKATTNSEQSPYSKESGAVTDSAAAGTAFSTGNKTYNNAISVSNDDIAKPLGSVIEAAMKQGKATGLVTTDNIAGATPAVWASHVRLRSNQNAIVSQYLVSGVNVFFGGGKQNFLSKEDKGKRTDKSILADFEAKGYKTAFDKKALEAIPSNSSKALGIFGSNDLPYVLDRDHNVPTLPEMSKKAIDILSKNKKGFVMMIEAGRIDHAGHANDFAAEVQEVLEFDATVKAVMDFAKKEGNTSVVITADHETGGMSLGINNVYELNVDLWNKEKHSYEYLETILEEAKTTEDIRKIVADNTGFTDLTDEEANLILKGDTSSYKRAGSYNAVISKRMAIGWAGHGHTAVDVGVWAYGPIASLVKGDIDNTDIAKSGAKVIGADLNATTKELQSKYLYPMFKATKEGQILFPAKALADEFGITYKADEASKTVTLSKAKTTLTVNEATGAVHVNGTDSKIVGNMVNGKLYLPLEAFTKLAGKNMFWDGLSERIVLNESL